MAKCLLCDLPFDRPNGGRSGEHVYPRWLEKYWPTRPGRQFRGIDVGTRAGPSGHTTHFRDMPIGTYQQVTAEVCKPCNNWMEQRFEAPAQRLLPPIFRGETPRLPHRDQVAMGAWGWKTASMIMQLSPAGARGISQAEYHSFRQRAKPPARSSVWIGAFQRDADPDGEAYYPYEEWWGPWTSTMANEGEPILENLPRNVYTIPFTVGNLFFLVFGTSMPSMVALGPRGELASRVKRVWPAAPGQAFTWPPGKSVDPPLLDRLFDSIEYLRTTGLETGQPGEVYGQLELPSPGFPRRWQEPGLSPPGWHK